AVKEAVGKLVRETRTSPPDALQGFVHQLAGLRKLRGEVIALRDVRYTEEETVASLEMEVIEATDAVSARTVDLLLREDSLKSYAAAIEAQESALGRIAKVAEADDVAAALDSAAAELEMLIEIVGGLKIADATQTTEIIERISSLYAGLNGTRAALRNKRRELARGEGEAQFAAQMKLLAQAL